MELVSAGFGDDIDDGASGSAEFRAVAAGGDPKLLHDLIAELVGRTVAAAGLGGEAVVVVGPVDQEAGLEAANASGGEIAVGTGGEAARVLRHAGSQQRQICETTAVERKFSNGAGVDQVGDAVGLGLDRSGFSDDGDRLFVFSDSELEQNLGGSAKFHANGVLKFGLHPR